ncbi:MAG: carboxypeptidase regulatory-like domain-containing protein [Terriglobales bacterium]
MQSTIINRQSTMKLNFLKITLLLLAATSFVAAQTLTGTVTNGTTGKPAAGVEVTLLTLSQGMNEAGSTKTDTDGKFTFQLKEGGPHLVRVDYQGANYFPKAGPVMPGVGTTAITIYDAGAKSSEVGANVHVMRVQAPDANTLQVLELVAVDNNSNPPKSFVGKRTWQMYLPEGAQIDEAAVQGPGGMPISASPEQDAAHKNLYYFDFPLRPGESRFQVSYHLPYSGQATLNPRVTGNLEHFALLMPKSMQFAPVVAANFSSMADDTGQSTMEVATKVTPSKDLSFHVAGTGVLPETDAQGGGQQEASAPGAMGAGGARPGGGLGTPEGTPDPLEKYRIPLIAICLGALALGGFWTVANRRSPVPSQAAQPSATPAPSQQPTLLLQALKEELFQLELERQQGKISEAEYATAKAALDQTLARAVARTNAIAQS